MVSRPGQGDVEFPRGTDTGRKSMSDRSLNTIIQGSAVDYASQEQVYKLLAGQDLYKLIAAKIFNVAYDDVTQEQRQAIKLEIAKATYGIMVTR